MINREDQLGVGVIPLSMVSKVVRELAEYFDYIIWKVYTLTPVAL